MPWPSLPQPDAGTSSCTRELRRALHGHHGERVPRSTHLDRTSPSRLFGSWSTPRPGDRVIDLGCAAGAITHYLSTFGADAASMTQKPVAVDKARQLFPELRFEVADVADLPFPDARFNKAVAAHFVEHIDDDTFLRMCHELRRVLTPTGTVALLRTRIRATSSNGSRRTRSSSRRTRPISACVTRTGSGCHSSTRGRLRSPSQRMATELLPGSQVSRKGGGPPVRPLPLTASACLRRQLFSRCTRQLFRFYGRTRSVGAPAPSCPTGSRSRGST